MRGFHGRILRTELKKGESFYFDELFKQINYHIEILPIQLEYLLNQALAFGDLKEVDGKFKYNYEVANPSEEVLIEDKVSKLIYDSVEDIDFEDEIATDTDFNTDPTVQIQIRRGQPKFRKGLLLLYNEKCIVSGCKIVPILEAAHITPHSKYVNYSMPNGLLLRSDIHTLFDSNLIGINPMTMKIEIHPLLSKDSSYSRYQGIDIYSRIIGLHTDYRLDEKGLLWRWEIFKENL